MLAGIAAVIVASAVVWLRGGRFVSTDNAYVQQDKVSVASDVAGRIVEVAVKENQPVKAGDLLDIDNGSTEWQVRVVALSDQRGPAAVARQLYEETPEGIRRQQEQAERRQLFAEPADAIRGRPTKRDRRVLDRSRD